MYHCEPDSRRSSLAEGATYEEVKKAQQKLKKKLEKRHANLPQEKISIVEELNEGFLVTLFFIMYIMSIR